jgi:HEPN domain-containing protein
VEKLNSYFGMGENDFLYAKGSMETGKIVGNYNVTASLCAQAGEKFLKAVIERCFSEDADSFTLLRSHNLRAIYNKVITKYDLSVDSRSCKWLGDFYYDARYPGDNFVTVNEKDAKECLDIVEQVKMDVEKIFKEQEILKREACSALDDLKAF